MSLKWESFDDEASNFSRAASMVQQTFALDVDIHGAKLCLLVHAGILLFSTTQCLQLFVTLMPQEFFSGMGGEAWATFSV
jgi:hypothetical protein